MPQLKVQDAMVELEKMKKEIAVLKRNLIGHVNVYNTHIKQQHAPKRK